jgi:hypothetical protein
MNLDDARKIKVWTITELKGHEIEASVGITATSPNFKVSVGLYHEEDYTRLGRVTCVESFQA